jgi:phage replication initiation protein
MTKINASAQVLGAKSHRPTKKGSAPSEARPTGRTAARIASPRVVTTGGKSPIKEESAIVDWLNVTFDHNFDLIQVRDVMEDLLSIPIVGETANAKYGFDHCIRLKAWFGGQLIPFAMCMWGGEQQRGRAMISIEGGGCRAIKDWSKFRDYLESLKNSRITRVDLAVDLLDGDYTVDDAKDWVLQGDFNNGGRPPRIDTQGDWLTQVHGRTLYVGQSQNGKMMRAYEKGKQLGDLESDWVRFEVQFGSKDRIIPFEILTDRDKFFAGAYPALKPVLDVASEKIKTTRTRTAITLEKAIDHITSSCGKWINFFIDHGNESADLVEAVRVRALPRRLTIASLADDGTSDAAKLAISERLQK